MKNKPHFLYALTLLIETVTGTIARYVAVLAIVTVPVLLLAALTLTTTSPFMERAINAVIVVCGIVSILLVLAPSPLSLLAYLGIGSGFALTRYSLGARQPSTREMEIIRSALKRIVNAAGKKKLKGFSAFYVLDNKENEAYLIGTTLFISTTALNSPHFPVILAHEMGHLIHDDGTVILALRRFILPFSYPLRFKTRDFSTRRPNRSKNDPIHPNVRFVMPKLKGEDSDLSILKSIVIFFMSFAKGGLGIWLTSGLWARHFRSKDYLADKFVVSLNMKHELLEYLEYNRVFDSSTMFAQNWQPSHEERRDRI